MNAIASFSLQILIISQALLLACAACALLRFERRVSANRKFWESPTGAAVRDSGNSEAVLSGFLERRLALMHQRLNEVDAKLDEEARQPVAGPSFEHAVRMARSGASLDELTRVCGLSDAEARLVWRLHARSDGTRSAA